MAGDENVLGYGPNNPYIPPLVNPRWLLSVLDRRVLLTFTFPLITYMMAGWSFWTGLGNGDSYDGFFYNNAGAAGSQLYPMGLSKYYDLYSVVGLFQYVGDWIWIWTCNLLMPLTFFVPFDVWQALINGYSW